MVTIALGFIALILILGGLFLAWPPLALVFAGFVLLRAAALVEEAPVHRPAGKT